ncbi:hypothetical protein BKA56DRAFT_163282 [Ilyonectria sp. MPI-CAGE-AT-0026]|nr:hypothetical protein BKA56DRAFT_163282 [Ilyonectria sp. MPI-CAGE-AT-0026]
MPTQVESLKQPSLSGHGAHDESSPSRHLVIRDAIGDTPSGRNNHRPHPTPNAPHNRVIDGLRRDRGQTLGEATWARPRARFAFDKPVAGLFALASPPGHPATRTLHWVCTWCLFLLHVGGPISLPTRFGPSNCSSKPVGRHRDQLGRRVLTICYVAHGVLEEGGNPRGGSCKCQPRTSHAKYSLSLGKKAQVDSTQTPAFSAK